MPPIVVLDVNENSTIDFGLDRDSEIRSKTWGFIV